jgi:putative acetyltransferase
MLFRENYPMIEEILIIRLEEPKDYAAVHAVNSASFETPAEANLVELLRKEVQHYISIVAEENGEVVGHILFSPVTLSGHEELRIIGLGPVAVVPEQQRKGIGSELIKAGLESCKEQGFGAVIVLGHKGYYPRFGFTPSASFGIECEYKVPPEAFMAIELVPGYLHGARGIIHYHPAFKDV